MRISISNIAWDPAVDEAVAATLAQNDVDAIDLAPGKYFPSIPEATAGDIAEVRDVWAQRGISITGMQSLLFGTKGLNVFGSRAVQKEMLDYLEDVCRIGAGLGATRLVFGSPRNRDRAGLDDDKAREVGSTFFRRLGERAADHGVVVTLEPNPTDYGANFMTTSNETATIVREVNHPAIRMQLDTGACAMNGEDVAEVVRAHGDLVGHIHVSEPRLAVLGDGAVDHARAAQSIRDRLSDAVVCIEMLKTTEEPPVRSVERAVSFVVSRYRGATR